MTFEKIKNLKILIFKKAWFSKGPKYLPNSLRVLQWPKYPVSWLPVDFHPRKLAILDLQNSCLQLLAPIKKLENLSALNFCGSQFLTHIPDLSSIPNLKELWLDGCENLIEIHDGYMRKLKVLSAVGCVKLKKFPHGIKLPSLVCLQLRGCISLEKFQKILEEMEYITQLDLSKANFELPCSIQELLMDYFKRISLLPKLEGTYIEGYEELQLAKQDKVKEVLSSMQCSKISQFKANISNELLSMYLNWFNNVGCLYLSGNDFTVLPTCIKECCFTEYLFLNDCKYLSKIRGIPPNIRVLEVANCTSLNSESKSMLLSEKLHEAGNKQFIVPGASIPEWFDHCSSGPSFSFWFRNDFPMISLCFVVTPPANKECGWQNLLANVIINGKEMFYPVKVWELCGCYSISVDHILCDYVLKWSIFNSSELNEVLVKCEWNHVEVHMYTEPHDIEDEEEDELIGVKEIGMNVMNQGNRREDIQFINPFKRISKGPSNPMIIWDYKKLWKLQLSKKIKIFLWKAHHNELPIKENMITRGTSMDDHTCPNCGVIVESIMHTLVACPFAEVIWSMSPLMLQSQSLPQASFSSWWEGLSSSMSYLQDSVGMLEIAGFICWRIWKCRNAKVFRRGSMGARQVILLVMQQVNEFQATLQGIRVISTLRSNAEDITLKECNISDGFLPMCLTWFANVIYLDLSGNNFTVLPAHIKECRLLEELILDDCTHLREIREIPPNIFILSAINCTSLNSESTNILLSQELHEAGDKEFCVPGTRIPKLFEHCSRGPSIYFWFRNKFPRISLCFIIAGNKSVCTKYLWAKLIINGKEIFNYYVWNHELSLLADHIFIFDILTRFSIDEVDHVFLNNVWNHVEVCMYTKGYNGEYEIGINVIKAESRMEDIHFTDPYKRRKLESLNWDSVFMASSCGTASDKDLQQPQDLNSRDLTWDPMEREYPVDVLEDRLDMNDQAGTIHDKEYNNDRQWFSLQASLDKSRASFSNSLESNSHTITHQDIFYDNVDNDSDIYDEESRKDDDDYDFEDEEEQSLTSTNSQISESCEVVIEDKGKGMAYSNNPEEEQSGNTWDSMILECLRGETSDEGAKTSKIFLGSTAEAEHEPMFQKGGKLKEDVNLVPGSTSTVSTSTNKGGQQKNGPSNIKISEKDASIKRNAEATVHYKQNQAEKSRTQLPESRANQQSAAKEIEDGLISTEAFITEDNMDAFYASLETETTALSDTQINSVFVNTKPSEETQKALQILRDLVSKKFSLLLQPEESKTIKYILEYLLSLSPDDGISWKTKSVILQLSRSFSQWSLDYNDASHKLESAGADLAKVDELKEGLEANVREFQEVENFENEMWSKLADLEEEKRKLEEQINAIKAQIADYMSSKDTAAQRKRMVFDHGRRLKAKRDDLRNRVPRLRAEQEWAKINQANIEDEWLKLGEKFIASSSFEDWTELGLQKLRLRP